MICNALSRCASDIQLCQGARDGVEASGERNDIEFLLVPGFGTDALFGELCDGVGTDVDEIDVREVVDFVVVLLERWPL